MTSHLIYVSADILLSTLQPIGFILFMLYLYQAFCPL